MTKGLDGNKARRSRAGIGGPKTPEGKARSSRNALKHGLRAEKLAFHDEENAEFDELLKRFCEEHDPRTATEEMLVRELWRHACFLQLTAEAEGSAWRRDMRAVFKRRQEHGETPAERTGEDAMDAARAAAASGDRAALITRYRRSHERGFYDALKKLTELRNLRDALSDTGAVRGPDAIEADSGSQAEGDLPPGAPATEDDAEALIDPPARPQAVLEGGTPEGRRGKSTERTPAPPASGEPGTHPPRTGPQPPPDAASLRMCTPQEQAKARKAGQ